MHTWQNLLTQGNDCFNADQWQEAEGYYQQAIDLLDSQLHQNPKSQEAIQAWICSYHNLATLFQRTGELQKAQKCLLIPHQSMRYLADSEHADDELQVLALQALKVTVIPLLEFAQKHPVCDSCFDALMNQYRQAFYQTQTLH
ncbi:hypothetical protein N7931_18655 [Catenovulum sp. 2E275]|uniref:hypothetical protein n=1 Tax=Catenovulum sp. 2E275 TaxID=2980497 RepID=UPI0021D05837|nr:hypothetical protein [Catenovulum sp. 2E275]MCU4677640.1 hypothetical protein [Catenovulum sp. 2E275]